ncbi:hypothetical protein [Nocardioides speluncae]|uniref:hypothetical protein n=1 Tax=Nocardioides speluncae TaxID=2670337 RepID=UPI000D69016E|nr:hypothetical protein [Nocardioides speluncae]
MSLLERDAFVVAVDDLVVEFGNALHQPIADRFLLDLAQVPQARLSQIWRDTIGGRVLWDAPVYEAFFRKVRAVNETLPADRRLRVLLGDPDIDFSQVHSAADIPETVDRDAFYADLVEREVLAAGRHAVLIAGADHLRRGVHANSGPDDPNVATLLDREHRDDLYVIYPLPDPALGGRVDADLADWRRPSMARVDGTWLGARELPHRVMGDDPAFDQQVDAVLWFGPTDTLTRSRADPALYESGPYATELARRSIILSAYFGEHIDLVAEGRALATADPALDHAP